ncbi:OLD family endonuclease [Sphingobacteriales bacterium UPWRP_1]|nr:OLD family endonuclease [Sphingobacteriales bacterium UPWRP_1]
MIIKKVIIENFRAYKLIEIPILDGINVIIGKNDVGKSTILEALDIFFGQNKISIDINDKCIFSSANIAITVLFEIDKSKEYLIDTDIKTKLQDEFLLNKDGLLQIRKEWDCSKGKLTATSLKISLIANYPDEFAETPLPTLKINELKEILENADNKDIAFGLHDLINENKLEGIEIGPWGSGEGKKIPIKIDKRRRAEIRKAIYSVLENINLVEIEIPLNKEDCQNIFQSIEKDFPQYELFHSDRENKDDEKSVQDPLKVITKRVIKEQQQTLDEISKELETKVEEFSQKVLLKLGEMHPELANELHPKLQSKDWSSLFNYSFTSDSGIPFNKRGSGIRRLILLNFFRAEAENKNQTTSNLVYAFEEPETSQHADNQRIIMQSFIKIAQKENYQIIITTHSNNLVQMVQPNEVIFIKKGVNQPEIVNSENLMIEIANELGTLPNLNSNVAILVEGITDKFFLENINQIIPDFKNIIDLNLCKIPIFWVGGSNVANWVESRPLQKQNIVEFHLYDSDGNNHYKSYIDEINNWGNGSCAFQTNLPTIENYTHPDIVKLGINDEIIEEYFESNLTNIKKNLTEKWNEIEWDNLKSNWNSVIDISNSIKKLGFSKPKEFINEYLVKKMTKEKLVELGVFDEIKSWFETIKRLNDKYN